MRLLVRVQYPRLMALKWSENTEHIPAVPTNERTTEDDSYKKFLEEFKKIIDDFRQADNYVEIFNKIVRWTHLIPPGSFFLKNGNSVTKFNLLDSPSEVTLTCGKKEDFVEIALADRNPDGTISNESYLRLSRSFPSNGKGGRLQKITVEKRGGVFEKLQKTS